STLMPATVNGQRLTTFRHRLKAVMLTEPVSPIPEERFRFRDHDSLLGLAITHTQLPSTSLISYLSQTYFKYFSQCFVRKLLGQSFSLSWEIRGAISTCNYTLILQPLGDKGIKVIGGNTIRCFTSSDR
ncbi:hypothetical protein HID58_042876, partial [Brassica napus]